MEKIDRSHIRKVRLAVQWSVFLMVVYAGVTFCFFVRAIERGTVPAVVRPPSVEGFMPIGALMSLRLWLTTGIFDPVHPAALVLFIGALSLAVLLKKSFCGWICPVGTLSDAIWKAGERIFGRNFTLPKHFDYPLRSVKYLLTAFFLFIILVRMSSSQILGFFSTPYWKVADIKLLKFFTGMSPAAGITLGLIFALSLLYKNFWCRYLCPYGGLLGLLSMLSPVKIRRDASRCVNCGACSRSCPSLLPVDEKKTVRSPECTGCLTCVSRCPAGGALDASVAGRRPLRPEVFIAAVVIVFFGLTLAARVAGKWRSSVSNDELYRLVPVISSLEHP